MFSSLNFRVTTAACVVMMMMMMTEAAAMPKADRSHRRAGDGSVVETVPLQLDPEALVAPPNIRPLENSSISPWAYNNSHHESLYPPILSEAYCLLKGCLDSMGKEDLNLESKPIRRQVLVLRRVRVAEVGSGSGTGSGTGPVYSYHFRLEYRVITVGCTCVRHSVQSP